MTKNRTRMIAKKTIMPVTIGLKSDIDSAGSAVKHPIKIRNAIKSTIKSVMIDRDGLNGVFRGKWVSFSIRYLIELVGGQMKKGIVKEVQVHITVQWWRSLRLLPLRHS